MLIRITTLLCVSIYASHSLGLDVSVWNRNASGAWSDPNNWNPTTPDSTSASAQFGSILTSSGTITVDSPRTVAMLDFDSLVTYQIAGDSTLKLQSSTDIAQVSVASGNHVIASPLELGSSTGAFTISFNSTLTVPHFQPTSGRIQKLGGGTLNINNVRCATLSVSTGTLAISPGRSQAGTSKITAISSVTGFRLDLNDQDMIIDYTTSTPLPSVGSMLFAGYNNGSWNGAGIMSTSAAIAASTTHRTGIGIGEASSLGFAGNDFSGQIPDSTSALLRYTYCGDANLDGKVNTVDFNLLAGNFGKRQGWTSGDFNYDFWVDSTDFTMLASNFGMAMNLPAFSALSVPEPIAAISASAALLSVCMRRLYTRQRPAKTCEF